MYTLSRYLPRNKFDAVGLGLGARTSSSLFSKIKHADVHGVISFLSKIKDKGPNALALAVNARDHAGFTPLMYTVADCRGTSGAQHAKRVILHTLLSTPVDVNATDNWGRTACHFAAQNNDADAVNALISRGAQIDALDSDYFSAADYTMNEEVEHVLRLPHSINPHEQDALSLPLRPSKIRTKSPPSNQLYTGEEWWFGRVAPTHKNFAEALESHSRSEAEFSFELAESAIVDAAQAAADSKERSLLPAGEEYMAAFNDAFYAFARAENAVRAASLHASISNSVHRSNLPSVEYTAEFDLADGGPANAAISDLSAYHLGEEIGQFAMNDLDNGLKTRAGLTDVDTMLSLVESEKLSPLAAPRSERSSEEKALLRRIQLEQGQSFKVPRGAQRKRRNQHHSEGRGDLAFADSYSYIYPANNLEHPWEEDNDYEGYYDGDKYSERYEEQTKLKLMRNDSQPLAGADAGEGLHSSWVINTASHSDSATFKNEDADMHIMKRVTLRERPGSEEGCDIGADPLPNASVSDSKGAGKV